LKQVSRVEANLLSIIGNASLHRQSPEAQQVQKRSKSGSAASPEAQRAKKRSEPKSEASPEARQAKMFIESKSAANPEAQQVKKESQSCSKAQQAQKYKKGISPCVKHVPFIHKTSHLK
jgi:hypothetical protein